MALKTLYLGGHASLGIDGYVPVPAWNEFDKDADVVLSNSNRTATMQ